MTRTAAWLACALAVAGCGPSQPAAPALPGSAVAAVPAMQKPPARLLAVRRQAPDVAFVTAGGEPVTLERFAGRVVVLNLWATWCAPCIREMPSLDVLAQRAPAIAVVPVSVDVQGLQQAAAFLVRLELVHLQAYHDPDGHLMRRFGVHALPASFVIDREGRIAAVLSGETDWTSGAIRDLLARVRPSDKSNTERL